MMGHEVVQAEDGPQALELFEQHHPDLVLLDVLMPQMNGFEVCRRLRAMPSGADTPILYLTALSDLDSYAGALETGGDDFLGKPIDRTALLLRVRSLLRVSQMNRELRQQHDVIREQRDALIRAEHGKQLLNQLIVHDLKNPLSVIYSAAAYLRDEAALDAQQRGAVEDLLATTDAMSRMIMNLLDVAKSEDGELTARRSSVELDVLVQNAIQRQRRRFLEQQLEVNLDLAPVRGMLDRDLVQRLLDNLLDNCIKYAPPGSELGVRVRLDESGREAMIAVSDQGKGIPEHLREQVFEKYAQVDAPNFGAGGRMSRGLGLLFCRLAAEAHGGRIWNEANQPRGTVFHVSLPLVPNG